MKHFQPGLIVIILLVLFLAVGINFLVTHLPNPCGSTWLSEAVSPDPARKAVVFERDCGATTDFSTQTAIIKRYDTIARNSRKGGRSFFIAC